MNIKEMETKLYDIENRIKPDMYESFEIYIEHYKKAFYDTFGAEPVQKEPDFIQEVRAFLKIDHSAINTSATEKCIDLAAYKYDKKFLSNRENNTATADLSLPDLADVDMEMVSEYIYKMTHEVKDNTFMGRREKQEYDRFMAKF